MTQSAQCDHTANYPQGRIQRAGRSTSGYSLLVHSDSQFMVGQLTKGWKIKAANLRALVLVNEAAALTQAFGRCDPSAALGIGLVKIPPEEVVRVFDHLLDRA